MTPLFRAGERVRHRRFGIGTIRRVEGRGRELKVAVEFDDTDGGDQAAAGRVRRPGTGLEGAVVDERDPPGHREDRRAGRAGGGRRGRRRAGAAAHPDPRLRRAALGSHGRCGLGAGRARGAAPPRRRGPRSALPHAPRHRPRVQGRALHRAAPRRAGSRGRRAVTDFVRAARDAAQRIAACEAKGTHAFLAWSEAALLDQAERLTRAGATGPLAGEVVAVKDVIADSQFPTTCASKILEGWRSPFEATAVRRLREAGALVAGKTNCDEFAMGSSTEWSAYGPSRNPVDPARVPGGSSGGSAAAVAAARSRWPSARRPAGRCGSPRPSAASWGSNRPTGG